AVAPLNIVANINPDEDGNGLVPNLLGRVSATIQASPTVTAHIFDSDKDESNEFMRRGLLESILGEVVASIVAPINIVANINPDEDGNGLVPNLLGRVSATIQASPTVTAHLFDSDKDESNKLMRRGLLESILGEVVASAVAPLNIVANINPDEDGNGLVPNLLGRVSATIQASPTVTAHLFDSDKEDISKLLKRDAMASGIYTERVDDAHIAIYVPLTALTKGQSEVSRLVSAAGGESVQIVSMTATPTVQTSSAPTPAVTSIANSNIFLRIVVPSSKLIEPLETIQAMFPDIPEGAIRADLARTGSPTITSDNILRNGGTLPLPPATRAEQRAEALGADGVRMDASGSGSRGVMAMSSGVMLNAAHSPLVNRLRVTKDSNSELLPSQPPKVWEADPAKRADILCKRKEFMLLEARKQYMEKQAKASSAAPDHRAETTESCEVIDEKPATNLDNT
ncbi:hypothetical protein GGH15_001876, partial [Coemansia sp. RSA 562]